MYADSEPFIRGSGKKLQSKQNANKYIINTNMTQNYTFPQFP